MASPSKRAIEKTQLFQLLSILLFHLTRDCVTHEWTEWPSIVREKDQEWYTLSPSDMSIYGHPYDFRHVVTEWLWAIRDLVEKEPMITGISCGGAGFKSFQSENERA
ncbi:hypothetical protein TNCV_3572891 [Trichonephila clavipes]|nr:hypothetical protein TNCV_3572891 [Trichonephila clavipes]